MTLKDVAIIATTTVIFIIGFQKCCVLIAETMSDYHNSSECVSELTQLHFERSQIIVDGADCYLTGE